MKQLKKQVTYTELLAQAEAATSRKEAVRLIHLADKARMKLCREHHEYPSIYCQ